MARRPVNDAAQSPSIWSPLEAEQLEVEDYMNRRLAAHGSADGPTELDWLREALEESWPRVLAEVDAAIC